eukprot:COSAG05_NODE_13721_length_420_cov_0.638629_2_plen_109_part_00
MHSSTETSSFPTVVVPAKLGRQDGKAFAVGEIKRRDGGYYDVDYQWSLTRMMYFYARVLICACAVRAPCARSEWKQAERLIRNALLYTAETIMHVGGRKDADCPRLSR